MFLCVCVCVFAEIAVFPDEGCVRGQQGHIQETAVSDQPLSQRDRKTDGGELALHPTP